MALLRTYGHRIKDTILYYVGGIYRQATDKDIFLWAQAISFKVLITLVPVVILVTGILGRILQQEDAFASVARYIRQYLPLSQSNQLLIFLDHLQEAGAYYTTLGIVALLFSAMTLMTTLRVVISNAFQEEWHKHRTILKGYLFDIRMAAQVGLVFLLTFGLSILFQTINENGLALVERLGFGYAWVETSWRSVFRWVGLLVPYLLSIVMFFQLFYFVPKPHPPKRSALLGAVVTGLLWEIAKFAFAFYAASAARFDRYSVPGEVGQESFQALGSAFGLIIAFVIWAYYSGVVLIIGALIAVLHEKRHRLKRLKEQQAALTNGLTRTEAGVPESPVDPIGESEIPVPERATEDDVSIR